MKTMKNRPIGMFDSGVGGLSILRIFLRKFPAEDVLYIGDTAHFPYGEKTPEEISAYGRYIAEYFKEAGIKLLVIACNTATVYSLDVVKEVMEDIPVIGVIGAGARAALEAVKGNKIGVIATKVTVESGAYPAMIRSLGGGEKILAVPTQRFVSLVEGAELDTEYARRVVREDLSPFYEDPPSGLILGCTHFPGLSHLIQEALPGVELIDPAYALVDEAADILAKMRLLREDGGGRVQFLITGDPESFSHSGSVLLGRPITDARKLIL